MKSRTTKQFREAFGALPKRVQRQAREAFRLFQSNPAHPGLRFKLILPKQSVYSARVGRKHRAVAVVADGQAIWFWIGSHADYDELLKTMD